MKAHGTVHKYGDNVDTDVIIPARYLNSSDPAELAKSCMEDIDKDFVKRVKPGDIMVARKTVLFLLCLQGCIFTVYNALLTLHFLCKLGFPVF